MAGKIFDNHCQHLNIITRNRINKPPVFRKLVPEQIVYIILNKILFRY
jgi:hypothetical protein